MLRYNQQKEREVNKMTRQEELKNLFEEMVSPYRKWYESEEVWESFKEIFIAMGFEVKEVEYFFNTLEQEKEKELKAENNNE